MKILVVEDDELHAEKARFALEKLNYEVCAIANHVEEAKLRFSEHNPDLILLDIQLKSEESGIDFAEWVKQKNKTPIVFLTSFKERFVFERAAEVEPDAILHKPITETNLKNIIDLAILRTKKETLNPNAENVKKDENSIFVKMGNTSRRVNFNEILCIRVSYKNYCDIVTQDNSFPVNMSLSELEQVLDWKNLLRVHRTALVNIDAINEINEKEMLLKTSIGVIPIGPSYKSDLLKRINKIS